MRARDLTEDELRAVLVGRGVDEAATADVPRGILADLLGELRAADDARSAAKALGTAPSAPASRCSLLWTRRRRRLSATSSRLTRCARDSGPQPAPRRAPRLKSGLAMSWTTRRALLRTSPLPRFGPTRRRLFDERRRRRPRASPPVWKSTSAPERPRVDGVEDRDDSDERVRSARASGGWTAVKQKKPLRRLRRLPRAIVRGSSRAAAAGFLEATTGAARGAAAWAGAGVVGPGPVVVVVSAAAILGRGRLVAPLSALTALRIVAGGLVKTGHRRFLDPRKSSHRTRGASREFSDPVGGQQLEPTAPTVS